MRDQFNDVKSKLDIILTWIIIGVAIVGVIAGLLVTLILT